jgi:methylmalonyl-CoA/ethylmalonyl-CoA epimerase
MIIRIAHVAVVVEDLEGALAFWRDALGLPLEHVEEVLEQQATVAFLPASESDVELVKPTTLDSGVARFLAKRGPGIHHICFEVDDVAATLTALKARGIRLIDEAPRSGAGGKKVAFVHPESTHGVLVELMEAPPP